jgi:tetratricopeptide (TPR) repeat protein
MGSINEPGMGGIGNSRGGNRGSGGIGGPRGVSERDLMGCEVRATLAGFRSDMVSLSGRRAMDNPDLGVIVLHRMAKVDGFTFSGTSAFAPKDAKKAYEKGKEAVKKNKEADAERELQKAVDLYPKYAVAWYELGTVYQKQKKLDDARKCYAESLKADSKFVSPYAQLTKLAAVDQNWQQTVEYSDKLLKLNPYFSPEVYFYNAVANLNLKNLDAAEEHAREGLKMDTQNRTPRMNQVLGVVLAQKQDFKGAAESMRSYLKLAPTAPDVDHVKRQLEEIERQLAPDAASTKKPE